MTDELLEEKGKVELERKLEYGGFDDDNDDPYEFLNLKLKNTIFKRLTNWTWMLKENEKQNE